MDKTTTVDHNKDRFLLLNIKKGCKDSFNILYERYWELAYNNCYKRLKDPEQAKDIVQEIFINIWLKRENHIENFPAYLHAAVRNNVLKVVEKQKKTTAFLDIAYDIPAAHMQTESSIQTSEFFKSYECLIATLPPKRQKIFHLRFNKDLSTKAIAADLGLSRKTVQNQLGKAIKQLRVSLFELIF